MKLRTTDGRLLRGTVRALASDSLSVALGDGAIASLAPSQVTTAWARRPVPIGTRTKRGALVGVALGFLIPAASSLAKGKVETCLPDGPHGEIPVPRCTRAYHTIDEDAMGGMFFLGLIGTVVGLVVPYDGWARVTLPARR